MLARAALVASTGFGVGVAAAQFPQAQFLQSIRHINDDGNAVMRSPVPLTMLFRFARAMVVTIALSVAPFAHEAHAQDGATPEIPTIRTGAKLVLVPVTVTDRKGKLIDGLTEDEFALADSGVRQKIHLDTSDTIVAPVSLVVAVQCSGISQPAIAKINKVGAMIQPLLIGDRGRAAVIAYDDEIHLLQDFTSDGTKIRIAFQKIEGRRLFQGRMIDATAKAIE